MNRTINPLRRAATLAVLVSVACGSHVFGGIQQAGNLLVDVDATALGEQLILYIPNNGTMDGGFEARGGGSTVPSVAPVNGSGMPGIRFDGNDYLQHVVSEGGALPPSAAGLVGADPTRSIEVWAFNPSIANAEAIDFEEPSGSAVPDGPIHRYSFANPAASDATGATIPDSIGAADGVVINGSGAASFTGSRLTLSGGDLNIAPYVDLPNGLLSVQSADNGGSGEITVEGWVHLSGNQAWSRIFDFGSTVGGELTGPGGTGEGLDYLFLSAQVGSDVHTHRVEVRNQDGAAGGANTADYGTFTINTDLHFAVTWKEATGEIDVYENGLHVLTLITDERMSAINDVNNWLGRSNWPDNNLQGEFDEFRIYDRVLTAPEILRNQQTGPDVIDIGGTGALLSIRLVLNHAIMDVGDSQQAQVLADYELISGVDVTTASGMVYASSDTSVFTVDGSGFITAVGTGTATLTGSLNAVADHLSITVIPPTQPIITLLHRYSFNEAPGGTIEPDVVGGADGTVLGSAGYNGTGQLFLDGAAGSYVDLPNGIISVLSDATFEAWVTHNSSRDWERIFDFGISLEGEDLSGTGDSYLFLTPRSGDAAAGNAYRFAARPSAAGAESPILDGPTPLPLGEETHLAVSYDQTLGEVRLYADGVRVASGPLTIPLSTIDDRNNWLGRSQWNDPCFTGSFNEFRIYGGAMDDAQVAASFAAGPDAPIGGVRLTIVQNANGSITLSWPISASDYFLESSWFVGAAAFWDLVFDLPVEDGAFYRLTIPADQLAQYYRLSQ